MIFRKPRVLVLGDLLLDEWIYVATRQFNPEGAAAIVSGVDDQRGMSLGGVGIAAVLLRHLGASVKLMSRLSKNGHGAIAHSLLHRERLACKYVHFDEEWRIPLKRRYVNDAGVVVFRHDEEPTFEQMLETAGDGFDANVYDSLAKRADCVAVFDYDKGYVSGHESHIVARALELNTPVIVGAKPVRLREYLGADVVKLNAKETAEFLDADYDDVSDNLMKAAESLCHTMQSRAAVITAGSRGSACAVLTGQRVMASFELPAFPCFPAVKNCVGAGDAFLAGLVLDYVFACRQARRPPSLLEMRGAITAANAVAAAFLEGGGESVNSAVPFLARHDLMCAEASQNKIVDLPTAAKICQVWRVNGDSVVLTNGCFDLLHEGHLHLLEQAKQQGNKLVVAVNSDDSVRAFKGAARPVHSFSTRSRILAALSCVDMVVCLEEEDFIGNTALRSMITTLHPAVLVKGAEYAESDIVGWEELLNREEPGRVWRCPMLPDSSTTKIIQRVKQHG